MIFNNSYFGKYRKKIIRGYNLVSFMILKGGWRDYDFLNLGYVGNKFLFELEERDKKNIHSILLYSKVLESMPKQINSALEIGSGLGGGCYLLKKYYQIPSVTGIDYARLNVKYSNKKFKNIGINYIECSAEDSIKLNQKYDLILSVEAALLFYDLELFFKNVYALMTADSTFLYADLFTEHDKTAIENLLDTTGFKINYKEEINEGVSESIKQIQGPNKDSFRFKFLKKLLLLEDLDKLDAYNNSELHKKIMNRELIYMKYVITKK